MQRRAWLTLGVLASGAVAWFLVLNRHFQISTWHQASRALELEDASEIPNDSPTSVALPEPSSVSQQDARMAPTLDKAKRDAMREAIYRAWGMAPPDERTNPATWPTKATASGEGFGKDYVRDRIREDYIPLARDCYERH